MNRLCTDLPCAEFHPLCRQIRWSQTQIPVPRFCLQTEKRPDIVPGSFVRESRESPKIQDLGVTLCTDDELPDSKRKLNYTEVNYIAISNIQQGEK